MLRLARAATLAFAAAFAATPVLAQTADTQINMDLARLAAPWLQAENPNGDIGDLAATIVCVISALSELSADLRTAMAALPDFEDALDMAVIARPALEDALEACF